MGTKRHQTTHTVYQFLWDYVQEHGFPPTQQEIAAHCFFDPAQCLAPSGQARKMGLADPRRRQSPQHQTPERTAFTGKKL